MNRLFTFIMVCSEFFGRSLVAVCLLGGLTSLVSAERPNILFISVDDLRPELGSYGSEIAVTPNLDAFAGQGLQFNRAYCQQAICGPSRASILTGLRPDSSGITHNYVKIRELNPEVLTLPQQLGLNGYDTLYFGKVFHHGDKDPTSWNRPDMMKRISDSIESKASGFALPENETLKAETRKKMFAKYGEVARLGLAMGPAYESADVPDNRYGDGRHADLAVAALAELAGQRDKPFFLAVGFNKPHLNWVAPKRYWDLYDRDEIPMATQAVGPRDHAAVGLHPSFELRVRAGIPKIGDIPPELARTLMHSYLACVSYIDAQIGRVMRALDESGKRDNTIVIVWSDHGYHLGDMGIWGKATNYELGTRVPLMIWTPDMPASSRGRQTESLVELIDMYPTLCELAGVAVPDHVEGTSFGPLITHPDRSWKTAAFSQFPSPALREWGSFPIRPAMRETYFGPLLGEVETRIKEQMGERWDRELFEHHLTGYAMRTDQHRLILWKDTRDEAAEPLFVELFDHQADPDESTNVAAQHPDLVDQLSRQLNQGWSGAVPR